MVAKTKNHLYDIQLRADELAALFIFAGLGIGLQNSSAYKLASDVEFQEAGRRAIMKLAPFCDDITGKRK